MSGASIAQRVCGAAAGAACVLIGLAPTAVAAPRPADTVLRNGFVYTVDARDSDAEALAVRAGAVVYVGTDRAPSGTSAAGPRSWT